MAASVLLLSCYELGHPPLGIAWPLAFLKQAGIPAEVVDLAVEPFPDEKAARAALVLISVPMHTALRLGVAAAQRVRRANPGAHIACFGLYAWLNADHLLSGIADSVTAGEAEPALVALARAVLAGDSPAGVEGISTASRRAAPPRARLGFPVPERSALPPLERYARFVRGGRKVAAGYTEASRGCLHLCRHCPVVPIYGGRFFVVPVEVVLADVRAQVAAGARHISFGDPDFLNGPSHALRVARALHAELPELSFDVTTKIEHLLKHRALLGELRDLGCAFVVSAVESLSDEVLRRLAKGHTAADVEQALALAAAAGIALHPTLCPFTPWESLDGYLRTIDFFRDRGMSSHVPPVQLSLRLLVPPGSALLEDPESRECFGPLDQRAFSHPWVHPDPRMDAVQAEVAVLVERDEAQATPAAVTWETIRRRARAAAGLDSRDEPMPPAFRPDPPRLTEHWFC